MTGSTDILLRRGLRVKHDRYGVGEVFEFYEFYNQVYVDVMFDSFEKAVYVKAEDLTPIHDEKNL